MELWIRSQDRKLFRKSERLCMVQDLGRYYIVVNGDIYGEYKTKERALEVLDEIQKFIERGCKEYKSNGDYYTSKYEYSVFQMPQD